MTAAHFDDSVVLTVNGVGGSSASDDLVIRIVNDVPAANVDGPYSLTEDAVTNTVSGDVLANDTSGADTPAAFVSWSTGDTTAIDALNTYGTLTQNGDGTWSYALNNALAATQALSASDTLSYTLHYTMQDADGDTSPATLTITITGANDGASVVTAAATGPDATVYESGLNPDGSDAAADTETTTGTFSVSASDGIASVVIGGSSFTLTQVQAFDGTQTVNTGQGVLTLTGYSGTAAGGTISYSYTLSATIDNATYSPTAPDSVDGTGFNDSVHITVNGVGGTTASDDLVIRAVDDVPTAMNDGPTGVTEDGLSSIGGNVLTNDLPGADTPAAFTSWSGSDTAAITALNTYGTLTQNSDGTWNYALDNTRAATQALTSGSPLSYDLHYTMQDADGDPSSATLTITITGADDGASVVTAAATGPDATVLEHGLTSVPDTSETTTGSFTLSATDGIHDVVIGGTTFTLAQVQAFGTTNGVVNTGEGVLTLTGYTGDAHSGTVNYSYTLSAPIDNATYSPTAPDTVDATGFNDSVHITVNGTGGTTASDDLVIRAVDDVPTAMNDGPTGVTEDGLSSIGGNVLTNDLPGADTPAAFTSWSGSDTAAITALNTYGTLTQNSDGTWNYALDNTRAATQALTSGSPLSYDLHYTMQDADGDPSSATLTITITGADDGASVVTAAATGPDATVLEHGLTSVPDTSETTTGSFTLSATDGIHDVVIGGMTFTLAQVQAFGTTNGVVNTGEGVLTLTGYTGDAHSGTVNYSYTLSAPIDNATYSPTAPDSVDGTGFNDSVHITVNGVGGTTASDDLVIRAVDDVPTARADTDSLGVGGYGPETGNVITGVGTTSGAAGADTVGADGAQVSGVVSSNVPANSDTTLDISGNLQVQGQYGMLTLNADGGYSYSRDAGSPGGVSDVFTYTLTDGDGDTSPATLTISLGNGTPTLDVPTTGEAGTSVNEAGLPARGLEPEGSGEQAAPGVNGDPSETTAGVINFTPGDTPAVVTINGTAVTGTVGQTFAGTYGTLTITGTTAGTVSYSYTLADNTSGNTTHDDFSVVVTDADGDATPAQTLSIDIVDDVPTARADTDSLGVGGYGPETGNVITGVGTTSGAAGADTVGADGAQVSGVASNNVPANTDTTLDGSGNLQVQGQYGMLTLNADGGYSYSRDAGSPGGVDDVFTYTLTDGDGDTSPATLTISIGDATPTLHVPTGTDAGTSVNEAGLPAGSGEMADGNPANNSDARETTAGAITFTSGDTPAAVTIGGVAVSGTVGQTFSGSYGTLTILAGTDLTAGTINYSYTLTTNTSGDSAQDSFAVAVTDASGDHADGTLNIAIVDDVPTAHADTDSILAGGFGPADGNVVTGSGGSDGNATDGVADTLGADGLGSISWDGQSGTTVTGAYGVLTVGTDGSYSYTRNPGTSGGVSDVFTYTLTDGDGDSDTATLTISLGDGTPTLVVPTTGEAGTSVNEAGLGPRGAEPAGSGELADGDPDDNSDPSETTAGVITYSAGDTPATVSIGGTAVTAVNQTIAGAHGTLTITSISDTAIGYSYTLTDNTSGNTTHDDFSVVVTDVDGDATPAQTLSIDIVDDVPTARADTDSLGVGGYGPETGNVITGVGTTSGAAGADTVGADGAQVSGVASNNVAANTDTTLDGSGNLQVQGQYGMLTLNADGGYSYSRDAGSPGGVSDVFTYTLTDGDGDTSPATLTISIGDATPTLHLPTGTDAGTSVNEAGLPPHGSLPAGSGEMADGNPANNSDARETTAGAITFSPGDTPAAVTIGGVAVSGTVGQTFTGTYGTLTILAGTDLTAGTINYSYTLTTNTSGDSTQDSFAVAVTDASGDHADGTLNIAIVDDVPTAHADTDSILAGGFGPADGNVVTGSGGSDGNATDGVADTLGADGLGSISWDGQSGATVTGTYGVLTVGADGSYSYARNAGTPGGVSDVFHYTLTDGDGDTSSTTLTISIGDATPTLHVPTGTDAGTSVNEAGLPAGSGEMADGNPANNSDARETTAGAITFTSGDTPAAVTIGGVAVSGTVGQTFTGTYGTLTILAGTDLTAGTINYSYTLTTNTSGDSTQDSFAVAVTDASGDHADGTLNIAIVDDVPTAHADTDSILAGGFGPADGNVVTGSGGSDGNATDGVADTLGADGLGSISWDGQSGATVTGTYGVLTVGADGSYSYARNAGTPGGVSDVFHYTLTDGDGDTSSTTLTISIGDATPTLHVPTGTDAGTSVNEAGLPAGSGEMADGNPANNSDARETTAGAITFTSGDTPAAVTIGGVAVSGTVGQTFTGTYGTLTILAGTDLTAGTINYSYTLTTNTSGDSTQDSFAVAVTDASGDHADGTLNIAIVDDVPTAHADTDSILAGGFGPADGNVVTGSGGSDGNATDGVADTLGADGFGSISWAGQSGTTVTGTYGVLTVGTDGSYSYARNAGTPGGVSDVFHYTLTDGDGDTDTATLTIDIADDPSRFIVGSNDGDVPSSQTDHVVPNPDGPVEGPIVGGNGADVLIGDPGGSQLAPGQTANIVMVLDTSGSMDTSISFNGGNITRIHALQQATITALQDLTETGAENIRVHLTEFNTHSAPLGTYDLIVNGAVNTAALDQAIADINTLNADGGTNYEAGLGTAAQWISGTQVVAITQFHESDHNSATGSGNDDDAATLQGVNGVGYSLVSGWGSTTSDIRDANESTSNGWGVEGGNNSELDSGEVLRFDFGPGTDFDGGGTYTTAGFNGPPIAAATFALKSFGSGGHTVNYTVTDSDGTSATVPVTFSGSTHTFTITAAAGLTIDHIAFSVPSGSGAVDLKSVTFPGPIPGADVNTLLFISDGEPTYHYVGNGTTSLGGDGSSLDTDTIAHITGTGNGDSSSEVGTILGAGFDIQSVGINVGEAALDVLDQVEGDPAGNPPNHSADNITTAEQLTEVIGAITGGGVVASTAGDDQISGGGGNDILFGDAPFTNTLADAQGLTTPDGAGWQVFQQLEAGQGTDSTWDRTDTINYIQGNLAVVAGESGRSGGNDILYGGAGDDIIFGQEGNDQITGGLGNDQLSGGTGNDTFVWNAGETGTDTITGFAGGDVLDLSALLQGENAGNLSSYLQATSNGTDTTISIDADGGSNFTAPDQSIVLHGVATDISTLISSGSLVTDQAP